MHQEFIKANQTMIIHKKDDFICQVQVQAFLTFSIHLGATIPPLPEGNWPVPSSPEL